MTALAKARLIELDASFKNEKDGGNQATVQFNPETLKVTFANQIVQPKGNDQAAGNAGRQFVGEGTTKLALQLWFDASASDDGVDDVRRLTEPVVFFMRPQKAQEDPTKLAPPGVRFQWGSFLFDGLVESLDQSLEFFSPDGKPLRASMSLTLSQQKILEVKFQDPGQAPALPGQSPLSIAKAGDTIQNMVGRTGGASPWQAIAAANGIEDALRLAPGRMVDLNASVGGAGVRGSLSIG